MAIALSDPVSFIYSILWNIFRFSSITDTAILNEAQIALIWASVFITVGVICLFVFFGFKLFTWLFSLIV